MWVPPNWKYWKYIIILTEYFIPCYGSFTFWNANGENHEKKSFTFLGLFERGDDKNKLTAKTMF